MKPHLPRRRVWRAAIYAVSLVIVMLAVDAVLVQLRRTIHPGFDTTRIVTPVLEDGSIDFLTAVDSRFGSGVTPENNAAIPILQALGRQAIRSYDSPDGLTDALQMPHLPETGDYFVPYDTYSEQHGKTPTEWTDLTNPRRWPVTFDDVTTQWVKDNQKPLALISEAAKLPRFFIPFYAGHRTETMIEIQLKHVKPMRDACRALESRALIRLAANDINGFRADLLTVHRLTRLLGQQATMIERVVALTIEISACEADRVGISSGKLSADELRAMAADLAALSDTPSMADSLDMGERYFALDTLQVLARRSPYRAGQLINAITSMPDWRFGPPALFLLVPIPYEAAMRSINHYEDGALVVLRQPTYPQRVAALQLSEQQIHVKNARNLTLRDLAGPDWPIQLFAPALRRALDKEETARMENRLTQIALMLSAFKLDHGAYPDALGELQPTYVKAVPNDLFSEKPLIYSRTEKGYTLYSVGPNMIDDGGKTKPPFDDISASLP
jgi:hypothetical protein